MSIKCEKRTFRKGFKKVKKYFATIVAFSRKLQIKKIGEGYIIAARLSTVC